MLFILDLFKYFNNVISDIDRNIVFILLDSYIYFYYNTYIYIHYLYTDIY